MPDAMEISRTESRTKIKEALGGGEGPSSTPEFRQAVEEGLLEVVQGQLQGEGVGRSGVSPGVSGISATTAAPFCSTAPSPLPSFPTSRDQDLDVNWNDRALEPILKTPSKSSRSSLRKGQVTTPSSSMACSPSEPPAKVPRLLLPSPGKRWLQSQADGEVLESQSETVQEMAEQIVCGELYRGPLPEVVLHQSEQYCDVLYLGKEDKTTWPTDLPKSFVLIPKIDKALMLRNSSDANANKLKELLLKKYHEDLPFVNPTLSYKGEVRTEETLSRWIFYILENLEQYKISFVSVVKVKLGF